MSTDLATQSSGGGAVVQSNASNLLSQIVEAARDPQVDAAKMEQMAELAMRLQDREVEQQFNRDFIAACSEMPVISKTGRIEIRDRQGNLERVQGTFAKFEDLNRVVKPILDKHNLWITFELGDEERRPSCRPILWHRNGFKYTGEKLSAPIDDKGSKSNTQGVGSTTTYLKRYTMVAALNIVTEGVDDDGNGGNTFVLPQERKNTVEDEAAAAFEQGRYDAWYREQSPKDRAYMVSTGKHAEYGHGAPAIEGPKVETQVKQEPTPEQSAEAEADQQRQQWVDGYVDLVRKTDSLEALSELQTKRKRNLDKFRTGYPDLWRTISDAHAEAFDRLSGNQDDSAGGDGSGEDLFGGGK